MIVEILSKFKGILGGSTAAKEQGIDIVPNDIDVFFEKKSQAISALAYVTTQGWCPVLKTEKERYSKVVVSWNNSVQKDGVRLDLIVATLLPEFCNKTRLVSLECLLERHLQRIGYAKEVSGQEEDGPTPSFNLDEYSRKLLEKIIEN